MRRYLGNAGQKDSQQLLKACDGASTKSFGTLI